MLQVTPRARTELHGMLMRALAQHSDAEGEGVDLGFRLVAGKGDGSQLGLTLDTARPGDEVVDHDGRSVLVIDSPTCDLLGDTTLDVVETGAGARLGLRRE